MSKPDKLPRWADTGGASISEPAESKKDVGWAYLEKPAHNYFNWLLLKAYQWIKFVYEEVISIGHNDNGTHKDNSIDAAALASDPTVDAYRAVTTDHIRNDAVTQDKIADDAVGTDQLIDDAVTQDKIADDAVGTDQLIDDAVTDAKLSDATALSVKGNPTNASANPTDIVAANDGEVLRRSGTTVGFGTIIADGIADDTITDDKLAEATALSVKGNPTNASANPTDIVAGSDGYVLRRSGTAVGFGEVATAGIANDAVTADKLRDDPTVDANRAVTTDHIRDGAIVYEKIGADAVNYDNIYDQAIIRDHTYQTSNQVLNPTGNIGGSENGNVGYPYWYGEGISDYNGSPNFIALCTEWGEADDPCFMINSSVPAGGSKGDVSEIIRQVGGRYLTLSVRAVFLAGHSPSIISKVGVICYNNVLARPSDVIAEHTVTIDSGLPDYLRQIAFQTDVGTAAVRVIRRVENPTGSPLNAVWRAYNFQLNVSDFAGVYNTEADKYRNGFHAVLAADQSWLSTDIVKQVAFTTVDASRNRFNHGLPFNDAGNKFIAPRKGLYHFSAGVIFRTDTVDVLSPPPVYNVAIARKRSGDGILDTDLFTIAVIPGAKLLNSYYYFGAAGSVGIYCEKGDEVYILLGFREQSQDCTVLKEALFHSNIVGDDYVHRSHFSGHLVY
jgi:hypothetical protein